ncbi:MAG: CRTAC1 family protein [Planctomycetes bacterium]|nr:CRTAC1 family protein [Planctomycetota bacterium]
MARTTARLYRARAIAPRLGAGILDASVRLGGPRQWAIDAAFVAALVAVWHLGRAPEVARDNPFGFRLREVARESGLVFTHVKPSFDPQIAHIEPHVAGMGAAVSVVDVDQDGWPDLYVTNGGAGTPNALFVNRRDGRFEDRAQAAGLSDLNRPGDGSTTGSTWADYDGDGDPDVFVYRLGRQMLLRNEDGRFRDVTQEAGLDVRMNSFGATWFDLDRDGDLDLYVTAYFRDEVDLWQLSTTRIMQESFEFAQNGGRNRLFENRGDGTFVDVTERSGTGSTRWTLAVAAVDLDGDGWQDLYLANDYGPEEYFRNRGDGTFEAMRGVGLEESSKSGMAAAVGDFAAEGALGVYVTNISKRGYLFQGNNLRVNRLARGGTLRNVAEGPELDCGWAWGAQFGDLNNDGLQDLFVVNGFVSASKERDYWFGMSKIAIGSGRLAEDARWWPPMEDRSLSGYEPSCVLVNQGRLRFVNAAQAVGVTDLLDGRAVALADFWNRGQLDVVVANQGGPLLLYRNDVDEGRNWLQVELVGRGRNREAYGALVRVETPGHVQCQAILAQSGLAAQNDRRLHFGLGDAQRATRIEVRWPAGAVSVLENERANRRLRVEEPSP